MVIIWQTPPEPSRLLGGVRTWLGLTVSEGSFMQQVLIEVSGFYVL